MEELDKKSKLFMWSKINELISDGLNYSQIARRLEMNRQTVSKYASMSLDEFMKSTSYQREYAHKLDVYEEFVVDLLEKYHFVSAAQVHDRLREHYPDMIKVADKTVFNFVRRLRLTHDIPKTEGDLGRQMCKLPETDYGEYAQCDFGEKWMERKGGGRVKVYFFVMVLSRSRYKYVFFSKTPFTSELAIYSHELAFAHFGGRPKKLVYDQDRVFIRDENLGDYGLTAKFTAFCASEKLGVVFCRKGDPQSKGKVENAVRYVKHNFLSAREFVDIETLNEQGLAWLARTANGTMHSGIRKIPAEEFAVEKEWLAPYRGTPALPEQKMEERVVRKDNTVMYEGNFYTVPIGTYRGPDTSVYVHPAGGMLQVFNVETGKMVAEHPLSGGKGMTVRNANHCRRPTATLEEYRDMVLAVLPPGTSTTEWLDKMRENRGRYFRDSLRVLESKCRQYSITVLDEAIVTCLEKDIFNANTLMEVAEALRVRRREPLLDIPREPADLHKHQEMDDMHPETSKVSVYDNIINEAV